MGLFSSCQNKKHIELICDIGNGGVSVALVQYSSDKNLPTIIFNERINSPSNRIKKIQNIISLFNRDLNYLLGQAFDYCVSFGVKPTRASCFYSSPLNVSETNIIKVKQKETLIFSESIIGKILIEGERGFFSTHKPEVDSDQKDNLKLIERRITSVKLNGYQTHNPIGKKFSTIDVALFISAIPQKTFSLVEESIGRFWNKVKIDHHTFSLASFAILKNEFPGYGSFLTVNIVDDVTEISLVNNFMLLDTFAFPLGKRGIIERIEKDCSLDFELAGSVFSMYNKDEIHSESTMNLSKSIESAQRDWVVHFDSACNTFAKKTPLPNVVYLIAENKSLPFYEKAIKGFAGSGFSLSNKEIILRPVLNDVFSKYITYSSPIHKDFYTEVEALYVKLVSPFEKNIIDNFILE